LNPKDYARIRQFVKISTRPTYHGCNIKPEECITGFKMFTCPTYMYKTTCQG